VQIASSASLVIDSRSISLLMAVVAMVAVSVAVVAVVGGSSAFIMRVEMRDRMRIVV